MIEWIAVKAFFKAVPIKVWVGLLIAAVLIGSVLGYGHQRYLAGEANIQAKYDAHLKLDKKAHDKAVQAAKDHEARDRQNIANITANYEQEKADALAKKNRVIDGLRDGTLRLRPRLTCGVPQTPVGAGGIAPTDQAGFTRQDGEVAFGIADDGDTAIRKFNACSAILRSERGLKP